MPCPAAVGRGSSAAAENHGTAASRGSTLDTHRSFGGVLDDAETRLAYYRGVIDEAADAEFQHDPSLTLARCGGPAE